MDPQACAGSEAIPPAVRSAVLQGVVSALDHLSMSLDVAQTHIAPLLLHLYPRCSNEEVLAGVVAGLARVLPLLPSESVFSQVRLALWG